MKQTIIKYILTNPIINDYLSKVDRENKDDFSQHIYLIIFEMIDDNIKYKKIKELYKKNQLGQYIIGIITNQLKSNTSSYTKLYKDKRIILEIEINDEILLNNQEINVDIIIKKIIDLLNNTYPADAILYKLYRGIDPITNNLKKPMTYQEIQKLIGVNYQAVRNSIMKTDKLIKERIKLYE